MLKWTKNKEDKWNSSGKKFMEMARVDPHTPVFVTHFDPLPEQPAQLRGHRWKEEEIFYQTTQSNIKLLKNKVVKWN